MRNPWKWFLNRLNYDIIYEYKCTPKAGLASVGKEVTLLTNRKYMPR